jgi:hypothetical protein
MRRMLWAALLALPICLLSTSDATAQCASGNCPPGFGGSGGFGSSFRSNPFSCGALCFRMFGGLHQEGPLFNYGPYSGYYPFEPYGPWTSDLRYNGPSNNCAQCGLFGRGGCGLHGFGGRFTGLFNRGDSCGGRRGYAISTFRNIFTRLHPFQRCGSAGCASASSCAEAAGCGQPDTACGTCVNER